ncbi:MAG: hypothetical protein ACFFBD_30180 [Candidatus Hodarchaeota archaeon]
MKELEIAKSYLSKALDYYVGALHLTGKYLGCQLLILALVSVSDAMIHRFLGNITNLPKVSPQDLWPASYETRVADLQKIEEKYPDILQKGEFSDVLERTLKSLLPSSQMAPLISINFKAYLNEAFNFLQNAQKLIKTLPKEATDINEQSD